MDVQKKDTIDSPAVFVHPVRSCFQSGPCWEAKVSWNIQGWPHNDSKRSIQTYMSHEKYPGWLGYKGHYTTQLFRDYNKPL